MRVATTAARGAPRAGYRLHFRPATHAGTLACWLAVPAHADPSARPLVAIHGIRRGAREQAELFAPHAAARGSAVIAPLFDTEHWPGYQRLHHTRRPDLALLRLLQQLQREHPWPLDRVHLFGFSGGAQFAHRFAMLNPHRIARLSVASAGWYTFPDGAVYPYGLAARPEHPQDWGLRMRAMLDAFLRLPIQACVGANDTRRDPSTRTGVELDLQQGRHRRARAERWTEALAIAAAVRGIAPRITFEIMPGVGHDFRRCVLHGGLADLVLPARTDAAPWRPLRPPPAFDTALRRSPIHPLAAAAF